MLNYWVILKSKLCVYGIAKFLLMVLTFNKILFGFVNISY